MQRADSGEGALEGRRRAREEGDQKGVWGAGGAKERRGDETNETEQDGTGVGTGEGDAKGRKGGGDEGAGV